MKEKSHQVLGIAWNVLFRLLIGGFGTIGMAVFFVRMLIWSFLESIF